MRGDTFKVGDITIVVGCEHLPGDGILYPSEWGPIRCDICDGQTGAPTSDGRGDLNDQNAEAAVSGGAR